MKTKIKSFIEIIWGKKYWFSLLIVAVIGIYFYLGLQASFFWGVFFLFLIYDFDNRIIGWLAILTLVACPIYLSVKQDAIAEQFAVFAFFFLVITVALQMVELYRHPERFKEE
jgi:hypothetical protein